jgi:hypothetical protein
MPRRLPWVLLYWQIPEKQAMTHIDGMKPRTVTSSNLVMCSMCATPDLHLMRYRILTCASPVCTAAKVSTLACKWACKTLTCQAQSTTSIYVKGEHLALGEDAPSRKLTKRHKDIARELCTHGLPPFRIRNAIAATTTEAETPALGKLQNFVAHYRKTEMNNTDDIEVVTALIREQAFCGEETETAAFSFSSNVDEFDLPSVGDGSDEDPFIIGFTTKRLLKRLDRDPSTFVFHLDATYKLNSLDYPLFVCGISDNARSFHLVALFVTSQEQEAHFAAMLNSLRVIYTKVVRKPLILRYILGDACRAQYNAVVDVFRGIEMDYLMCFYHVMANVNKHINRDFTSLSPTKKAMFIADIYDMHYATNEAQYHAVKLAAEMRWEQDDGVAALGRYFHNEWLSGCFTEWQCFHTPVGYATTNNPVEQFNGKIKHGYGIRCRLKLGFLIGKITHICEMEAGTPKAFSHEPVASSHIMSRATELRRKQDLFEVATTSYGSEAGSSDFVVVVSKAVSAVFVKPRKKKLEEIEIASQMGANAARMERDEQPMVGWAVNVRSRTCPCKYFFKYGKCVHLLHALFIRHGTFTPAKRSFVSRRTYNKKRTLEAQIAEAVADRTEKRGRPIINGPALSLN